MRKGLSVVAVLSLAFLGAGFAAPQSSKDINADWLAADIRGVQRLSVLLPIESQTIKSIKTILGETGEDCEDLGFGAKRIRLARGNGYTSFYVDAFIYKGAFAYYAVGVDGSSESWPLIRKKIVAAWEESGGPAFRESLQGLSFQKTYDDVFRAYKREVGAELG
ncbi:MAG: hypothetical protein ACREAC_00955, partial [Blastocatellia bacterium]